MEYNIYPSNSKETLIYREVLPKIWALKTYYRINHKKEIWKYSSYNFLQRLHKERSQFIEKPVVSSTHKLWRLNRCAYCNEECEFESGLGDHICGKGLNESGFTIPCCRSCNSSKGKKDLMDWWIIKKNKNIYKLHDIIFSLYVRGTWKILKEKRKLDDEIHEGLKECISQLNQKIPDEQTKLFWGDNYITIT